MRNNFSKQRTATIAFLLFSLTGCVSIVDGRFQPVTVVAPDCPGAACTLRNSDGTYYVSSTPGSVQVNRDMGDLKVSCSKDGYPNFNMTVDSHLNPVAWGNAGLAILGPIGLIAAGIDAATNAQSEYPDSIVVPMVCQQAAASYHQPRSPRNSNAATAALSTSMATPETPVDYGPTVSWMSEMMGCNSAERVNTSSSNAVYRVTCAGNDYKMIQCEHADCRLLQ